jgi:hypothetical protein
MDLIFLLCCMTLGSMVSWLDLCNLCFFQRKKIVIAIDEDGNTFEENAICIRIL